MQPGEPRSFEVLPGRQLLVCHMSDGEKAEAIESVDDGRQIFVDMKRGVTAAEPQPVVVVATTSGRCPKATFREIVIPETRSTDRGGRVRVDNASLCISSEDRTAVLYFRASAMNSSAYEDRSTAPWVHLELRDERDSVVANLKDVVLATAPAGGYRNHRATLPTTITNSQLGNVTKVRLTMGFAASED
jgi:hypothetical protein